METIAIKIILNQLEYPVKVLLAWGEAIDGKNEFRDFLMKSPYKELGISNDPVLEDLEDAVVGGEFSVRQFEKIVKELIRKFKIIDA